MIRQTNSFLVHRVLVLMPILSKVIPISIALLTKYDPCLKEIILYHPILILSKINFIDSQEIVNVLHLEFQIFLKGLINILLQSLKFFKVTLDEIVLHPRDNITLLIPTFYYPHKIMKLFVFRTLQKE